MNHQLEGNLGNMYSPKYIEQEMVRNLGNKSYRTWQQIWNRDEEEGDAQDDF